MKSKRIAFNEYTGYITTDVLPFELPIIYSNKEYYRYLIKRSKTVNVLVSQNNMQWKATKPLQFKTYVRSDRERLISIISPLSYMDILFYLKKYEKQLLHSFATSPYSIRYPVKKNPKFIKRGEYILDKVDKVDKKLPTYYRMSKYYKVYEFENSKLLRNTMNQFPFFTKFDIKACFDSIYTHSYKWIEVGTGFDIDFKTTDHMLVKTDNLIQNINAKKTNGLLIGPEYTRMMAELLLGSIDKIIKTKLVANEVKHRIFRFVDDYYIFADSVVNQKKIEKIVKDELARFQLQINDKKIERHEGLFVPNQWRIDVNHRLNFIDIYKMSDNDVQELLDVIYRFPERRETVVSYIVSTLTNKYSQRIQKMTTFYKQISIIENNKIHPDILSEKKRFIKKWIHTEYVSEKMKWKVMLELSDSEVSENMLDNLIDELETVILLKKASVYKCFQQLIYFIEVSPKYINTLKVLNLVVEMLIFQHENEKYIEQQKFNTSKKKIVKQERIDYKTEILNVLNRNFNASYFFDNYPAEVNNLLLLFEFVDYNISEKTLENFYYQEFKKGNLLSIGCVFRYALYMGYEGLCKKIEEEIEASSQGDTIEEVVKNFWGIILFPKTTFNEKTYFKEHENKLRDFLSLKKNTKREIFQLISQSNRDEENKKKLEEERKNLQNEKKDACEQRIMEIGKRIGEVDKELKRMKGKKSVKKKEAAISEKRKYLETIDKMDDIFFLFEFLDKTKPENEKNRFMQITPSEKNKYEELRIINNELILKIQIDTNYE